MWLVLSVCFVTITAILGITELLRRFWLYIMRPKESPPFLLVIKLKEDIAVQQIWYALEFCSWEKKGDFSAVAVIANELSAETNEKIKKIIKERNDIIFYNGN